MIEGIFIENNDLEDVNKIFNKSYGSEFNLNPEFFATKEDTRYIYIVVYENKVPVGAGRIKKVDFLIEKVTVLHEHRRKYFGDLIVRMLVDKAFQFYAKEVRCLAFQEEKVFFEKIGFIDLNKEVEVYSHTLYEMKIDKKGLVRNCCKH